MTIVGVETVVVDVVTLTIEGVGTGVIVVVVAVDIDAVVVVVVVIKSVVVDVVTVVVSMVADDLPSPTIPAVSVHVMNSTYASVWTYVASKQAVADSCGEQMHFEHPDDDTF